MTSQQQHHNILSSLHCRAIGHIDRQTGPQRHNQHSTTLAVVVRQMHLQVY